MSERRSRRAALVGRGAQRRPLLLGRDGDLALLGSLLDDAVDGRGRVALVLGEAGIGKTRLAEAVAHRGTSEGFAVAWGRCPDAEAPAYWPWTQALRDLVGATGVSPFTGDRGGARVALFASVVELLERALAERPAVIVLEDIHWADAPSLALLHFVVGALPGLPALLLLTSRDDPLELSEEATGSLARLPSSVRRMALAGLDPPATASLVNHIMGVEAPETLTAGVHHRTGGNPFYVTEVARLHVLRGQRGALEVPPGIHQVLHRRLARLSQPASHLLGAAAVAGEPDVELLAAVTDQVPERVLALLDEAVRARLVVPTDTGFVFAHALVRETLYDDQGPARRAELHRRTAEVLESRAADPERPPRAGDTSAQLATHWARAYGADAAARAAAHALEAARDSMARTGYEQSERYYRLALDGGAGDRVAVLTELGQAQVLAGQFSAGRQTLREAAAAAARSGRGEDLARAVLALGTGVGGFEVDVSDREQCRLLAATLAALPAGDGALRAAALARLSLAEAHRATLEERVGRARDAVEMARRVGDARVEVSALAAACDALSGPDHVSDRLRSADRMLALALSVDDAALVVLARRLRVVARLERGDLAAVDDEIAAYARDADRLRLALYAWPVPIWRGMRALMDGDIETARRRSQEAESLAGQADSANARMMVLTLGFAIARAEGRPEDVAVGIEEILADPYYPDSAGGPGADAFMAAFFAGAGQAERARRHLRRLLRGGVDRVPRDAEWLEYMWSLGDAAILLDETDAARLAYEALVPYAELWAVDGIGGACFGVVAEQLGRLAAYLGLPADARRWSDIAVARYRTAGVPALAERAGGLRTERDSAAAAPHAPEEGEFRRAGPVWHLRFRGGEATVPDSKGLGDLATLLARPGREVHVLDLIEGAGGPPARAAARSADPVLDAKARAAYRARLVELEGEIAGAGADADIGRATTLRAERDVIAAELGAALGLGGRPRPSADGVERARKAVGMRIATALRLIDTAHPALGRHLRLTIVTGRFCVYRPEQPTLWHT